ncbi:MAG TPA: PDZ domain-containing protein [Bryobacteraceae bacterium]|jgi:membrane-associated protease RseP (regulator of RpoE activity)
MKGYVAAAMALVMAWPASALAQAEPVIDTKFITDPRLYQADLGDCRALAGQRDPGESAVSGGIGGALLGAAVGALIGYAAGGSHMAAYGARTGAAQYGVAGAQAGAANASDAQERIMMNCMMGRGYHVLDAPVGMGGGPPPPPPPPDSVSYSPAPSPYAPLPGPTASNGQGFGVAGSTVDESSVASIFMGNDPHGAAIASVATNSSADAAGIKPGDVIVQIDGHRVSDFDDVYSLLNRLAGGVTVPVRVNRSGKIVNLIAHI